MHEKIQKLGMLVRGQPSQWLEQLVEAFSAGRAEPSPDEQANL